MAHVFIGDLSSKKLYNLDHIDVIEGWKRDDGSYTTRFHFATEEGVYVDIKFPKLVDSAAQVMAWLQQFEVEMINKA